MILFLNVSFGIFAFLPHGWVFMSMIMLLESVIAFFLLTNPPVSKASIATCIVASNITSGIVGIIISMILNGGWWLVVWMPWVGKHEANLSNPTTLLCFCIYYAVAFLLSVAIEWLVNYLYLRKQGYNKKQTFRMTLIVNIASYIFGSIILYTISFNNIQLI